ncbi:MAG: translation initiation factor eIF-2B [Candidatus Pacearchaeota archaeon]|jgi:ribose 1,5-bisphosphate isomerase
MKKSDEKKLSKIYREIKEIKIQGATNIAKSALYAYSLSPTKQTKQKLISLRSTEPMLVNVLNRLSDGHFNSAKEKLILNHFSQAQDKINKYSLHFIKNKEIIFTHCHSTNVIKSLINAKKQGIKFEVYNTETRPLYQGRKTAKELSKSGISVTNFVDSAIGIAIEGKQGVRKVDKIFLGADAILSNGDVVNKVGSGMIAEIAKSNKIPVYIIADSWKFSKNNIKLEQRKSREVWDYNVPAYVKVKNPSFEKIPALNITKIISDLGILSPKEFVRKARETL